MIVKRSETAARTYTESGVRATNDQDGFKALLASLRETFELRKDVGRSLLDFGYFASVLSLGGNAAIAISTDGIGTKAIVAQILDKYDTVGIDCVAMNANDVICVGAEPISMTDYIAVDVASDRLLSEIGVGLLEGARQANINIPGGEISQIPSIIKAERPGFGFDLVGTCIGVVQADRVLTGSAIADGDAIIGLASDGIHSNGLTLAREALSEDGELLPHQHIPEFKQTLGEELLRPTRIYVKPVLGMLNEELSVKALVHITSDGFLNLTRVQNTTSFVIDDLPEPQPIFKMIAARGPVEPAEMYRVFNMGVGFAVVAPAASATRIIEIARDQGCDAKVIGHCEADGLKQVRIPELGLTGHGGAFAETATRR